jgi:hypothetical protein
VEKKAGIAMGPGDRILLRASLIRLSPRKRGSSFSRIKAMSCNADFFLFSAYYDPSRFSRVWIPECGAMSGEQVLAAVKNTRAAPNRRFPKTNNLDHHVGSTLVSTRPSATPAKG